MIMFIQMVFQNGLKNRMIDKKINVIKEVLTEMNNSKLRL